MLAALRALGLPALSDGDGLRGYEYVLRMRVDRLKASAVAELEKEVADTLVAHAALVATKPESLWLTDLDEFDEAWSEYCSWRTATYASSAGTVPLKKKVVRKVAKATKA